MATQSKKPNKKVTVIAIIAVVILLIVAIAGTVTFLKDRGKTEAINLEEEQNVNSQKTDIVQPSEEQEQIQKNQQEDEQQQVLNDQQTVNEQQMNAQGVNIPNQQVNTQQGNAQIDNIQETTIERIENVEIPERQISEGHFAGWVPMEISLEEISNKINVTDISDIKVSKKAITKSGENLVTKGEEILYEITIKNTGNRDLRGIEVKDKIPENTTFVDEKDKSVKVLKQDEDVVGLIWKIDLKSKEETKVSFKVVVNDNAKGTISNAAMANGENSEVVKNSIIETAKTAIIEGKNDEEPANIGDKITYTISIKNTGDIDGVAKVQDADLQQLIDDKILKIDEDSKEIVENLIKGMKVEVPSTGDKETKITFSAEILNIDGAIKNTAIIGEERPEKVIDTVNIVSEKVNTDPDNKVKPGDKFAYNIIVSNTGNVLGTVNIIDNVPEQLKVLNVITGSNINATVKENSVDFGNITIKPGDENKIILTINVEVTENATGDIKNKAIINGKEEIEDKETIKIVNIKATKTPSKLAVKVGETYKYSINLQNSGSIDGIVKVKDSIPDGTEFVSASIVEENEITSISSYELEKGYDVVVPAKKDNEDGKVEIILEVRALAKTKNNVDTVSIKNTAYVKVENGKEEKVPAKDVDVANINASKSSNYDGKYEGKKLKELDVVTYTITLNNKGNADGIVNVTDQIPDGTELKDELSIMVDNKVYSKKELTETGIDVLVPGHGSKSLIFQVVVLPFDTETKEIINDMAKIDGSSINSTTDIANKVYIEKEVIKVWDDNNNVEKKRPESIELQIKNEDTIVARQKIDISKGETKYTFKNLPKYDSNKNVINYTVDEEEVNNGDLEFYKKSISGNVITNKLLFERFTDNITVTKLWDKEPDVELNTIRPTTIDLQLKVNDKVKYYYTLNTMSENSHTFIVEKYDENGNALNYVADEIADLSNYSKNVEKTENGYKITNTYKYAKLVPLKEAYLDSACTQKVDINNNSHNFSANQKVYYKLSVTNKGKIPGGAVLTDNLPEMLDNYVKVSGETVRIENGVLTWDVVNLQPNESKTVVVSGTVKSRVEYVDIASKQGKKTKIPAVLYVRKDGIIPYEDKTTSYPVSEYTKKTKNSTVYLNESEAQAFGNLTHEDIYQLIERNNAIVEQIQKGLTRQELVELLKENNVELKSDEIVIWYVIKRENDGWHIDGVIRKISDLAVINNTLIMVQNDNSQIEKSTASIRRASAISIKNEPTIREKDYIEVQEDVKVKNIIADDKAIKDLQVVNNNILEIACKDNENIVEDEIETTDELVENVKTVEENNKNITLENNEENLMFVSENKEECIIPVNVNKEEKID